ncbi:MAG: NUDIX domain-containing protein [Pseudomonadales bacterium]|nr:NUDIX domain-containing protein [Pseudomonadales bacterium]
MRSKPQCQHCPLQQSCEAKSLGRIAEFPGRKPKRKIPVRQTRLLLVENHHGHVLLYKRPPAGIWGGLWSLPEQQDNTKNWPVRQRSEWPTLRHTFTHFHMDITAVHCSLENKPDNAGDPNNSVMVTGSSEPIETLWYDTNNPPDIGLPAAISKLLIQFHQQIGRHGEAFADLEITL